MGKKRFIDYITEIEGLRRKHKLSLDQVLMLQIAASFEIDKLNYTKLKEEFCNEN